ncbi:hypothetical protein A2U01_0081775 [Trifolium medium]|uniref:Uncharacterized protein n=1 Tax=Trifolium medium TaxID=97028 RepID=A0A392TH81_9FABA|nr:hypothetical protein [Trifolium medium]
MARAEFKAGLQILGFLTERPIVSLSEKLAVARQKSENLLFCLADTRHSSLSEGA